LVARMLKLFTVLFLTKLFCRSASKFLNTSAKFFFSWLSLPAENVLIPILTTTWKKITEIRYAPLTHAQYNYKIYRTHSHHAQFRFLWIPNTRRALYAFPLPHFLTTKEKARSRPPVPSSAAFPHAHLPCACVCLVIPTNVFVCRNALTLCEKLRSTA